MEQLDGRPFFWAGDGDTRISVLAEREGILVLTATFVAGPSIPDRIGRNLLVTSDAGYRRKLEVKPGEGKFAIPVRRGLNEITFRVLDKPTVAMTGKADRRPLLLGIKDLSVKSRGWPCGNRVYREQERLGTTEWGAVLLGREWRNNNRRVLHITGQLNLRAHFILGPSLPDVHTRRVLVTTDRGYRNEVSLKNGEQSIQLPIAEGPTAIGLMALDVATVAVQPKW